ncbi:DUF4157 domain-containing protein [Sphingomonas sp.]|uniref:eCIS core domain-containing protein n=1 Tax=Sphingomonas sp. TaxID=28214 RepID=UPI001B0B869A|nr:DUF4157 domain-containing protein [Sphingomonas sp.]MBO9713886.1 DUF4157 domain-containing protein [Sphingomonas sp.]
MSLTQARRDPVLTAPAFRDAGRPLDAATRSGFESGFGRDFSRVRVHDDAHAHDAARALDARAYAAGDHLVFGAGQYQPETATGRALIAHELAHTVQQAGVAMKADGPLPAGSDARLEAEADRAAVDVLAGRSAPALSRANKPVVFRNPASAPPPAPPAGSAPSGVVQPPNIKPGFTVDKANPPIANSNEVTIWLDKFKMPKPKGSGPWVQQAFNEVAAGKRLGTTLFVDQSYSAWKEDSKTDEYRDAWLRRNGFKTFWELANAITVASKHPTNPLVVHADIKAILPTLGGGLQKIKCDIDHIVEKHMGGTSQPSNLQLLTSNVNQPSGSAAHGELKALAQQFIDYSPDWKNVKRITLRIANCEIDPTPDDMSVKLETLLRANPQLGNAKVAASADRKPLYLAAGAMGETIQVQPKGETPIDDAGVRIVPGVKLSKYKRGAAATLPDTVVGELDNRAMTKSGAADKGIEFQAKPPPKPVPGAAAAAATGPATPAETMIPANTEHRVLSLDKTKFKGLAFYYPYLSPGTIKTVDIDGNGGLIGTGVIKPTVQFFGDLDIAFGPNELKLVKKLNVETLNGSALMQRLKNNFRFTDSSLDLDLMKFVPSGQVSFSAGPADKPIVTGTIKASVEGGAFVATGDLKAGEIPGITAADGKVTYNSKTGWSGLVKATSTKFPGATKVDVSVGMREGAKGLEFFGDGGVTTKVRETDITLNASWRGSTIGYYGKAVIPKPFPLVDAVEIGGSYQDSTLVLNGTVKGFTWKNKFQGDLAVKYVKKDGEDGKFSGTVDAKTIGDTSKMDGHINLTLHDSGRLSGLGEISYQVTKDIRPKLGIELLAGNPGYRVRLFGEVSFNTIPLTGQWPKPGGERRDILKGVGVKVSLPVAPVPGLSVYFSAKGSLGVEYGVGPLALNNVKFNGELWPLEDDPKVKAKLTGRLAAPAFVGVYGTFGARLGAEVFAGALGLNGGIDITPSLRLNVDAGIDVAAEYGAQGFSFEAIATVKGALEAALGIDLKGEIYGAYGLLSYTWTYPVARTQPKRLGPELKVTLGKLAYSKEKGITWPSLDQIDYEPKEFDPKSIISDLLSDTKPQKT